MFKKIKFLLYKKGYLKLDSLEKKIEYLSLQPDINKFQRYFYNTYIKTFEDSIIKHTKTIEMFLDLNISGEKSEYKIDIKNITLAYWYTDSGDVLENDKQYLTKWLLVSKKIVRKTESLLGKITTGNEYHNYSLLKNLYNDIHNIVDILFDNITVK